MKTIGKVKKSNAKFLFGDQFSLSESYASLLLGIAVVMLAIVVFVSFVRTRRIENVTQVQPETISEELKKVERGDVSSYTVVEGDTLWSIAEKYYKSGYDWVKIAKANNLSNPDIVEIGTKLTLPDVDTRILATNTSVETERARPEQQVDAISSDSYTVESGDYLWEIAIRAYGDGYRWPEIAMANNLSNPDIIHRGNTFKLPR
ncbi:MAG: LysM peptidoglycan-binding domain-containing protein [Candidatus Levybacteria bacterium]|nr:LysM peptidoglycan-binding domain-containing protein [Candidatus Levybacteria bacterium]